MPFGFSSFTAAGLPRRLTSSVVSHGAPPGRHGPTDVDSPSTAGHRRGLRRWSRATRRRGRGGLVRAASQGTTVERSCCGPAVGAYRPVVPGSVAASGAGRWFAVRVGAGLACIGGGSAVGAWDRAADYGGGVCHRVAPVVSGRGAHAAFPSQSRHGSANDTRPQVAHLPWLSARPGVALPVSVVSACPVPPSASDTRTLRTGVEGGA